MFKAHLQVLPRGPPSKVAHEATLANAHGLILTLRHFPLTCLTLLPLQAGPVKPPFTANRSNVEQQPVLRHGPTSLQTHHKLTIPTTMQQTDSFALYAFINPIAPRCISIHHQSIVLVSPLRHRNKNKSPGGIVTIGHWLITKNRHLSKCQSAAINISPHVSTINTTDSMNFCSLALCSDQDMTAPCQFVP